MAAATVAGIGNGAAFHKGREFAAWLGLVPRQHSTGGKSKYPPAEPGALLCEPLKAAERGR